MAGQLAIRSLLRLFLMGAVLVFSHTLIEFSQNPNQVGARMLQFVRGELSQAPLAPEASPTEGKADDDEAEIVINKFDPEFYEPIRETPRTYDYRRLTSVSSNNGSFWPILLGRLPGYNANIIPHPTNNDSWIIVSQREQFWEKFEFSEELACEAQLRDDDGGGGGGGVLKCLKDAKELPIERSIFGLCEYSLFHANFRRGPRDARMFYGPDAPYLLYGSQSRYICMGLWIQDIRTMLDAFRRAGWRRNKTKAFKSATELRRSNVTGPIEKNYFLFWDSQGKGYVHYNIWPKRSFAELHDDGSEAHDLAGTTAEHDQKCMKKLMPPVAQVVESIHQATNSLSITTCKRSDPNCIPSDENTFIMHIFHHKGYYEFHGVYEPFLVLFKRSLPFALHAISQKPFWIEGRKQLTRESDASQYRHMKNAVLPQNHTEFFYITSMSWKKHGQTYHGFIDDEIFLSFGIEDARSGAMDVRAGDLLQDLAYCD